MTETKSLWPATPGKRKLRSPGRMKPRSRMTPKQLQVFADQFLRHGNATKAIQAACPGANYSNEVAGVKGCLLLKEDRVLNTLEAQSQAMQENAGKGTIEIGRLIGKARSEYVRLEASKFSVEQTHGKSTQRHEHVGAFVTIGIDLSGQGRTPPQEIIDQVHEQE